MTIRRIQFDSWKGSKRGLFFSYGSIIITFVLVAVLVGVGAGFFKYLVTERIEKKVELEVAKRNAEVNRIDTAPAAPKPVDDFLDAETADVLARMLASGENAKMLAKAEELEKSIPDSWKLQLFKGRALMRLGRIESAGQTFSAASKLSPGNAEVLVSVASYYMALRQPFMGEKFYFEAIRANPSHVGAHRSLALLYLEAGMPLRAETVAKRGVQLAPRDISLRMSLGVSLFRAGHYAKALPQFEEYLRLGGSKNISLHMYMGGCLERTPDGFDAAEEHYRAAMDMDSNAAHPLNSLVLLLTKAGKVESARKLLPKLLALSDRSAYALDSAGWVELGAGAHEAAEKYFNEANVKEPGHPEILVHMAVLHKKAGRMDVAQDYHQQAITAAGGNETALSVVREYWEAENASTHKGDKS